MAPVWAKGTWVLIPSVADQNLAPAQGCPVGVELQGPIAAGTEALVLLMTVELLLLPLWMTVVVVQLLPYVPGWLLR